KVSPFSEMSRAMDGRPMKVTGSPAACQQPPMKQPTDPAPRTAILSPATVRRDALVREPQALRRRAALPADVDRDSAARVPVAADPQPLGLHLLGQPLADADRHILVESAMIAEGAEEQLEALAFDNGFAGRIVDDEVREIGLAGDRAKRRELRCGEAHEVQRAG